MAISILGLVQTEMRQDHRDYALRLYDDLEREREKHKKTMPTAWLLAKFQQIGLEAYTHNFTLNYPLGGGKVFNGKNVYAILRAPRIGSTEAIVISTPYRTPESIHPIVMPSIPILMAFANFARRKIIKKKKIVSKTNFKHIFIFCDFQAKNIGQKTSFF